MDPSIKKLVDSIIEFYKKDIYLAYKELEREIKNIDKTIYNTSNDEILRIFKESLISIITDDIYRLSIKTFIYEFHKFRIDNGFPAVKDSGSAFNYYISTFDVKTITCWFEKFPMLESIISSSIKNDCTFMVNVCVNYILDLSECEKINLISEDSRLITISSSNSDPHNGGTRVLFFRFHNGDTILYKPRSLTVDKLISNIFEEVFEFDATNSKNPIPKILDRGSYGWQEFIEKKSISSSEIKQAYYNLGIFSSIFTVLGSTDIHDENLIFKGTTPYFIDLETALSPRIRYEGDEENLFYRMSSSLFTSIVGTTIIPAKLAVHSQEIMIGAINTPAKQKTKKDGFNIINFGTDAVDIAKQNIEVERIANPMRIKNNIVNDPLPYQNIFTRGFKEGIKSIILKKGSIISILNNFNSPIRYIMRPTAKYYLILDAALFPENLYSEQTLNKTLNYLKPPKIVENSLISKQLFLAEKRILSEGDIPSFYVLGKEKNIRAQNFISEQIFEETAVDNAIQILESISQDWVNFNERLIAEGFSYIREQSRGYLSSDFENSDIFKSSLTETKKSGYTAMLNTIISMSVKTSENKKIGWLPGIYDDYPISYMSAAFCSFHDSGGIITLLEHHFGHCSPEYNEMKCGLLELGKMLKINNSNLSIISGSESLEFLYTHREAECLELEYILNNSTEIMGDVFLGKLGLYLILASYLKTDLKIFQDFSIICQKNLEFKKFGIAHGELGYLWTIFRIQNKLKNKNACLSIYHEVLNIYKGKRIESVGWCNGLSGILMILSEMSTVLQKNQDYLFKLANSSTKLNEESVDLSVCHGASGVLQTLLFVYSNTKDKRYLSLANKYWKKVLDNSIKYGFYNGERDKDYLLGYFQGWSGFTDSALLLDKYNNNEHVWIPINLSSDIYQHNLNNCKEKNYEGDGCHKS